MKSYSRPFLAFLAGLVLTLAIAETSLWIFGLLEKGASQVLPSKHGEFRIAFLGNSHTAGATVGQEHSYSAVLDKFFKESVPHFKVQVFNGGMGSASTANLFHREEHILPNFHPHLIVVMAGEANIWNKEGYADFLEAVRQKKDSSLKLREILGHSRIMRWFFTIEGLRFSKLGNLTLQEREAYSILGKLEHLTAYVFLDSEAEEARRILAAFIKSQRSSPPVAWRIFLGHLARIELLYFHHPEKALALMEEASNWKPERPLLFLPGLETFSEDLLPEALKPRLRRLKEKFQKDRATYLPGQDTGRYRFELQKLSREKLEVLTEYAPERTELVSLLVKKYIDTKNEMKALDLIEKHLEANPLQQQAPDIYYFLGRMVNSSEKELSMKAREIQRNFLSLFPDQKFRFQEAESGLIEWISWDLGRMIKKGHEYGATVILQNYHNIDNYVEGKKIQDAIKSTAQNFSTPFIDTESIFLREMRLSGKPETEFFADRLDHPSIIGHQLIARIIYDYLNSEGLLPEKLRNLDSRRLYQYVSEKKEAALQRPPGDSI